MISNQLLSYLEVEYGPNSSHKLSHDFYSLDVCVLMFCFNIVFIGHKA